MLEFLFNIVPGLKASNFIKKRLQHRCFPVNNEKILRTPILKNIYERLATFYVGIVQEFACIFNGSLFIRKPPN